ncbi:MAG: AMP-binding protein [Paracoccaceae bacterium]
MTDPTHPSVGAEIVAAIAAHPDAPAMSDDDRSLDYAALGDVARRAGLALGGASVVGIYAAPSLAMGAVATACVIHGRPFVHLDPAMPQMVLHNVLAELGVTLVVACEPAPPGHLPGGVEVIGADALLDPGAPVPDGALAAAEVAPDDPIYLVATSGTTGRPKCIPVGQDAAWLSYRWRDAYTPYGPGTRVAIYIFAIWEMFRPLRDGAELWFPDPDTLMRPAGLAAFLTRHDVHEMLFTPSFYETFLRGLAPGEAARLPLRRVVLNGEVVTDQLIEASLAKLPDAQLWNLYSICETHDVCMTRLTGPSGGGPASVGVPMEHLSAVILDEGDAVCPPGTSGLLHFEGPCMLGPGYVNRPEETRLRFRELTIEGREVRLYDTGDRAWVDADGALHIEGRVAHMLKLRGHSIQTRELTATLLARLQVEQAVPWVAEVPGAGPALILYYAASPAQAQANAARWGLEDAMGTVRIPRALADDLRAVLPAYCVPTWAHRLDAVPLHPVSGKADLRALPPPAPGGAGQGGAAEDAVIAAAARAMGVGADAIDPALSFHAQGGDSLMAVSLMMELEGVYGRPVDFDLAMTVPLHRLDQLLTREADAPAPTEGFDRPGILLTGATGFLGGHVLGQAARGLPDGHVVYCLVRDKRRGARDRLDEVASAHGVDPARCVMVPGTLDAEAFGLDGDAYDALAASATSVVHCAAMVNLAIGRDEMLEWSARGTATVLDFCAAAGADLRFTSSSSVFPDRGGPWPEARVEPWDGITGYGAAKIAAEAAIAASGVPSALVRLPSLYDLDAPNMRDIYELILAASLRLGAWPRGLCFPMTDVRAAAAFLLGCRVEAGGRVSNLMAPGHVAPDGPSLPPAEWLAGADLPEGIARVIAVYPDTLRADATFACDSAQADWARLSDRPYASICDADGLLAARRAAYQGEPALT